MQSTMGVQSRPDASNRMTKHNGPPSHLLSTFRKQDEVKVEPAPDVAQPSIEVGAQQDIDIDADMVSSSPLTDVPSDVEDPDLEPEIVHTAQVASRLEPATEDEPMSTEDEEECSDIDSSPPRKETNYTTMEQRFAENKSSWGNSSPSKSGSRPRSTLVDSDDENMAFWSSQQSKRSKPNTYQTAQKSYFNKKTFGKPTPKPSPKARAKKIPRSEKKADEPSQEPESSFKVPKDIDSPTFKPKTKNGDSFSFGTFSSKENDAMQYSSDADSPLSSASSTMLKGMEEALEGREPSPPRKAVCPMCQTEVEPEILALFHSQPKQRIREQQQFCESHKLRSAAKEWEEAGYPVILWENFEARVQGLFPDIEKLLNPDASSYYRNILDTALKSGRAFNSKSILEGDGLEKITCGYYGSKGASKMLHAVIDRFSVRLRRLATTDRIVKTAGVAGYAQSVIVPELAMRLVAQDMNVDDENARQIMRDSMEIGERLNPELNDVVPVPAGEDVSEDDVESQDSEGSEDLTEPEDFEEVEDLES